MRAVEFQATAHQHMLRLPDSIPDGVPLRVLLLLNEDEPFVNRQTRRKPSPKLAGTVTMQDDLTAPAPYVFLLSSIRTYKTTIY